MELTAYFTCAHTQSLPSANLFLLEEGSFLLGYFSSEEKRQFENVFPPKTYIYLLFVKLSLLTHVAVDIWLINHGMLAHFTHRLHFPHLATQGVEMGLASTLG